MRETRGTPGTIVLKNSPKLTLASLIKRRKTTLGKFINELGISTYESLKNWCRRTGVEPPTEQEFRTEIPIDAYVNNPQEGVIVLQEPPEPPSSVAKALKPKRKLKKK